MHEQAHALGPNYNNNNMKPVSMLLHCFYCTEHPDEDPRDTAAERLVEDVTAMGVAAAVTPKTVSDADSERVRVFNQSRATSVFFVAQGGSAGVVYTRTSFSA